MHPEHILLVLAAALLPVTSRADASAAAPPDGAYAVLSSAPAPRAGCRVARGEGGEIRAPLYSRDTAGCPAARVADEEIGLGELAGALESGHTAKGSKAGRGEKAKGFDFAPTLDRIIDVRLVVLEARDMGLTELPEYRQALEAFRSSTLRTTLQREASAAAKPDPAQVDRLYKAAVKQWKVRSVMFDQEEDAKRFREAAGKGGSFDALAKAAVADKKAMGGEPGYVSTHDMVPELAGAVNALQAGQVSAPVKVKSGWVVLKLEGVRYPEDAKALEQARAQSLAEQQHKAVRAFHQSLVRKYAKVDQKLFDGLDLEVGGEAAFKELAKDQRPLVTFKDEPPITVGELTREISQKFFHGIADPIKEHRVNAYKAEAFEMLLGARLFGREGRERKLDQTPAYRRKVEEYDRVLSFNTFLERVIIPGVKVTEAEVQARYDRRQAEFTTPRMYRLDGLAYASAKEAQAALEKLRGGTDLEWLRANGQGQLKAGPQLRLEGALVSVNMLPASLVKVLTGAQPGELRLYATDDGTQHYAVRVSAEVAPSVKPYADAREQLARELEGEKIGAALKEYAAKLRQVQKVDVIVTRIAG
jgi:parvulin-like peptidyl-prolyl isomerase